MAQNEKYNPFSERQQYPFRGVQQTFPQYFGTSGLISWSSHSYTTMDMKSQANACIEQACVF